MSKVKVMRQPTASATLIFEFEVAASEFLIKNFTDGDVCMHRSKEMQQKSRAY